MYPARKILVLAALCLALAACGGGDGNGFDGFGDAANETPTVVDASPTEPDAATETNATDDEPSYTVVENCEGEPTEITFGTPVSGELVAGSQPPTPRNFYCVVVPDGVVEFAIELSGLEADLDLFAAYGFVEELGGGIALRTSLNPGLEDERIGFEPPAVRGELGAFEQLEFTIPGAYYIEVSGLGLDEATTYTLSAG